MYAPPVQWNFIVQGMVQGVNFRYATREWACEHEVKGWVKNEADGTVTIVAQGSPQLLWALERWCYLEAPGKVEQVEVFPSSVTEIFQDFIIIR